MDIIKNGENIMDQKLIDIDCPPGEPRPNAFIDDVIKDLGFPQKQRLPIACFFGNWTWSFKDVDDNTWEKAKPIIYSRLKKLHEEEKIRYANIS